MNRAEEINGLDPEIFIGLVGAVGTDLELVGNELTRVLDEVNYKTKLIRLSHLLRTISVEPWRSLPVGGPEDERYKAYMNAGTMLREKLGQGDALALLSLTEIQDKREELSGNKEEPASRTAYILRSLKHPDEVKTLRSIYGPRFILAAAYSSHSDRVEALANRIAESRDDFHHRNYRANAEELIQRDEAEIGTKLGQRLRNSYPLADVFLDTSNTESLKASIRRFIELLFGNLFHTPTQDECGMMHAQVAALRSGSLGRQVGAAITTSTGELIAVGTNDVPKPGGGLYWYGDTPDARDHIVGQDMSDNLRRRLLGDILKELKNQQWLNPAQDYRTIQELVQIALVAGPENEPALMRDIQLMDLLEYGRSVHAEMAAITDAARRGVSIAGSTLYTTTFPCHLCARHIVSAGVKKVVYIEPFPKSLVYEMYSDSISVEQINEKLVSFVPFVGVAPRMFLELFAMAGEERKNPNGTVSKWDRVHAVPKFTKNLRPAHMIIAEEIAKFSRFAKLMKSNRLTKPNR